MTDLKLDVLVVAAHPDDAEISVGGTLLRLIDAGAKVGVVDATHGEMGSRGSGETRDAELAAATQAMGIHVRENLDLPDGRVQVTVEARERLAALFRRYRPDAVVSHHVEDLHPDHQATGRLAREAWFLSGLKRLAQDAGQDAHRPRAIYHYLSHTLSAPTFVVDIGEVWERKLQAVRCYSSQLAPEDKEDDGSHFLFGADIEERMTTKARFWGEAISARLGEPFLHQGPMPVDDPLRRWLA